MSGSEEEASLTFRRSADDVRVKDGNLSRPTPIPPQRSQKRKVTDLRCNEARWFYQEPKSTTWTPFNGRDSLMIEIKYRKEKSIYLDESMLKVFNDEELHSLKLDVTISENENDVKDNGKPMVVVLNGQYRVNEENTKIDPIYWKDDTKEICRGTWFTPDYQPLEGPLADQIERNHLQYFRNQMIPEGTTVFSKSETCYKPILAELHTDSCDIRWSSVIDISLHQKGNAGNAILQYLWAKSIPLRRGYKKVADWSDAAAQMSHLVMVLKSYEKLVAQKANQEKSQSRDITEDLDDEELSDRNTSDDLSSAVCSSSEVQAILKRSNSQTIQSESDNDSPSPSHVQIQRNAKNTPKRQKVVISSEDDSSEDEDLQSDVEMEEEGSGSEEGEDNVFKEDAVADNMNAILSGKAGKHVKKSEKKSSKLSNEDTDDDEIEKFDHEGFDFIMPEKIRDAQKRSPSDPEYDPKTLWVPPEFLKSQTPGQRQWWLIKSAHYDTIILFKVGQFYETYHMDAVEVVKTVNIGFMKGSYAQARFHEHDAPKIADQLMNHGYKVARVEQTERVKNKIVKREVCRVTCNGTRTYGVLDGVDLGITSEALDPTAKYLLAIKEMQNSENGKTAYGVCMIDTTTANIKIGQFEDDNYRSQLRTLLAHIVVVRVLVEKNSVSATTKSILGGILCSVPVEYLLSKKQFLEAEEVVKIVSGEDYYGSEASSWPEVLKSMMDNTSVLPKPKAKYSLCFSAFGAIFWYLRDSFIDVDMLSMKNIELYHEVKSVSSENRQAKVDWKDKNVVLDGTAVEVLKIVPNGRDSQQTSLYHVINKCSTAFGRRLLRSWLLQPICDPKKLKGRQDAVKWMASPDASTFVNTSRIILKKIPDLDRLLQKIHTIGLKFRAEKHPDSRAVFFDTLKTNQRKIQELLATIDGFKMCNRIRKEYIWKVQKEGEGCELLNDVFGDEKEIKKVDAHIKYFERMFDRSKAAEDGKIVPHDGCDELKAAVKLVEEAEEEIEEYRKSVEREFNCEVQYVASGKLKYLLEMPEDTKVPSSFVMKTRRKGFIRYLTAELEIYVAKLDEASKQKAKLADDPTRRVFEKFGQKKEIWAKTVDSIANFDVLMSLTLFSKESPFDMCMPEFDFESEKPFLIVDRGVHPCLALQARNEVTGTTSFIANSTTMGESEAAVMLLTGPSMSGKSTLMRQTAVLCILAHIGSMVPANSMRLTPIDRIFTRIGPSDRIMCGESTFFIELKETDVMLKNATKHSLLLLDELGRGTSTSDGTAIASAVLQNIADSLGSRTFFSTHYHFICKSFLDHPNVRLAHMKWFVDKENEEDPTMDNITFSYKLDSGICPKPYGFYAAKLAGISLGVLRKAYKESNKFVAGNSNFKLQKLIESARNEQISVDELRKLIENF